MDELEKLLDSNHYVCVTKEHWEKIIKDLEILALLVKWFDFYIIKEDYEYLYREEIDVFKKEMKKVHIYLSCKEHYVPEAFREVGDSDE